MEIKTAEFLVSSARIGQCPDTKAAEFAFIGRSNVGKSSLINMLTGKKGLAMTSSKPGKTLLINHFHINNEWYLVDLPGYGYARASKEQRKKLRVMIEDYVLEREQLYNLFVLIDSRLKPQQIDLEFIEWLGENSVPFAIIFTKIDKQSKGQTATNVEVFRQKMLEDWEELPPIFLSSAEKHIGKEEILSYIDAVKNQE
ncbi:MAG: ribosome biogenesis GTP-binding protein YihA/YsxC [Prevotellaceae bacterium]|jgi:GTP-binding protein|nr:ribosome biogenesis GTP-binding protein YihA/YsxC [Prevotellaceae bacterium]